MMLIDAYDDNCDKYSAGGFIAGTLLSGRDKDRIPLIMMMIIDHDNQNGAFAGQ